MNMQEVLEYGVVNDVADVVRNAMGPEESLCTGYLEPGAQNGMGYVVALKMSADVVAMTETDGGGVQHDVSYKQCLRNDACMGQVNLRGGGGFIGRNGALWGYDLVRHDALDGQRALFLQPQHNAMEIPVYDITPLLKATERLFGRAGQLRFPLKAGAHVMGASMLSQAEGPVWLWGIMGVAIPADRNGSAVMLTLDTGTYGNRHTSESELIGMLNGVLRKVTYGMAVIGKHESVVYDRIYIGYKSVFVRPGEVGSMLACTPHLYLAQQTVPRGKSPEVLCRLSLSEWERALRLPEIH